MEAYLNHARIGEPMLTEPVLIKESTLPWQAAGRMWTASGYGARIPSHYMAQWRGRWRRVYVCIYSNSGTAFIGKSLSSGIRVDLDEWP